ncbi:MAG: hypothetical protein BGO10_03470 [Chlamydia sp. 32-24]|nr:MAG: hypothetical protein BGO10_03470 [Chlamydia sp. 32-24]
MQKGHILEFSCLNCKKKIQFSLFQLETLDSSIVCSNCSKKYVMSDETLKRQITKFSKLCQQIVDSEEILSNVAVGVTIGSREVKIPYKILLSRMNSSLDLQFGSEKLSIYFRFEPIKDMP